MTSQGLGSPFGPGERIEGYQVCGLRGSAFVADRKGSGTDCGYLPGDEMMFRYLQASRYTRNWNWNPAAADSWRSGWTTAWRRRFVCGRERRPYRWI